jgi:hypothetical protein
MKTSLFPKRLIKFSQYIVTGMSLLLLGSCSAPMNLNFDSARMMDKGDVEIQGSYSRYHYKGQFLNENVGAKLSVAPNDWYNLKIRGEAMIVDQEGVDTYYFELDNKFSFRDPMLRDFIAFSLPFCLYHSWWGNNFGLDPRLYFTFSNSDKFEFTMIPKCHIIFGSSIGVLPGISVGMGFSKDLNRWAIRPEIGYDSYLSYGVGFSYFLKKPKVNQKD